MDPELRAVGGNQDVKGERDGIVALLTLPVWVHEREATTKSMVFNKV